MSADSAYVTNMEKGQFTDSRDKGLEDEGIVKDNAQISGRWGWVNGCIADLDRG